MKFLLEQSTQSKLAHLRVIVRAGSLSDPEKLSGLAHFTARAMLRGTRNKPYAELTRGIEILGAAISVGTDQDSIVFDTSVIAANLGPFLDLLKDVLVAPSFDSVK